MCGGRQCVLTEPGTFPAPLPQSGCRQKGGPGAGPPSQTAAGAASTSVKTSLTAASSRALKSTPSWFGTVTSTVSARLDGRVRGQLRDELFGLADVAAAEAGEAAVEVADLVLSLGLRADAEVVARSSSSMIGMMLRLTDTRGSRSQPASAQAPRKTLDLLGLQLVERHAGVLGEQGRAHQVHALLGRPLGGGAGAGAPPDAVGQAGRPRLDRERADRRRSSAGSASRHRLAGDRARGTASVCRAGHVGVGLAVGSGT